MAGHGVEMQPYIDAVAADVVPVVAEDAGAVAADAVPVVVELVVDVDVLQNSLMEMPDNDHQLQRGQPCTIYQVLKRIRSEDPSAYDPQLVSIGPYHHGDELLLPMERIKRQFLHHLISRDLANTLFNYITALDSAASVAKASNCYSEYALDPDGVNDFVKMMVLDGCFIVEFLVRSFLGEDMGELDFVNWNRTLVENDLLRLENQIPFFLLESLFLSSVIPALPLIGGRPVTLKELACSCVCRDIKYNIEPIPQDVYHLLHLRHSSLAPTVGNNILIKSCSCMCVLSMTISKITDMLLYSFLLLLSVLLRCCRPFPSPSEPEPELELAEPAPEPEFAPEPALAPAPARAPEPEPTPAPEPRPRAPRSIPSATKLHEAGIKFRVKNKCCVLAVTFSKTDGIMEIPLVSIQAVTGSQFRNLVAFEQCCPEVGNHFTSYVALMDSLIDKPEDVALLEYSGILESKLGDDEEVCQLFNKLGRGGYLTYERHPLKELFKDVKDYYGMKRHWWRAMLAREYFNSPWSAISLAGATILLLLTSLQAFYQVYPYYHPQATAPPSTAPSPK